jgi:hypothetical protein
MSLPDVNYIGGRSTSLSTDNRKTQARKEAILRLKVYNGVGLMEDC